jgi:integrase
MARIQPWTDDWARGLPHPPGGEVIHQDPRVSGHRLVLRKTRKTFEVQRDRPLRYGPRKTFKVQVGSVVTTTIEEARKKAIEVLAQVERGLDPRPQLEVPTVTTLGSAWEEFKRRPDLRPSTRKLNEQTYNRCLKKWEGESLANLAAHPVMARDEHRAITEARGPRTANMAMSLLRAIHRHAAQLDTSLSFERHPCTAVDFHDEKPREGAAIPGQAMPQWSAQLEKLREVSPIRASFHMLCLRLGTRPGELAARKISDIDYGRKILTLPTTKTYLVEVPLTAQCLEELTRVRKSAQVLYPGSDYIFPARADGHLSRFTEPKDILAYSGNSGRHTHHTLAAVLDIPELVRDVLEGRSLLKAGLAGRGYIERSELGPKVREAQQLINDKIDELFACAP